MPLDIDLVDIDVIEGRVTEPRAEIGRSRRPVRKEKAPDRLAERGALVDLAPPLHPLVRTRERNAVSPRRPLTEIADEEAEARAHPAAVLPCDVTGDRVCELLAAEAAIVERVPHRGADVLELRRCDRRMDLPCRVAPLDEATAVRVLHRAPRGEPERELLGWMEMQRSPNRPRLHERSVAPERVTDVLPRQPADARRQRELRSRLHLRVDPARGARNRDSVLCGHEQRLPRQSTRPDRGPRRSHHAQKKVSRGTIVPPNMRTSITWTCVASGSSSACSSR